MRKGILWFLILLLVLSLVLSACRNKATEDSRSTDKSNGSNTEPTASENGESDPLSEEMKEQILDDFATYEFGDEYDPKVNGIFQIERYYGSYDGAVAVMLIGSAMTFHSAEHTDIVAGSTIHYNYGNSIRVWKDGSFFTMQEAYEQGILTAEQVEDIANYRYVEYPINL